MVKNHSAFTLFELIFAILIISIAVLSLPTMTQTSTDAADGSMVQEAIFGASTELNQLISFKWDENSTDSTSSTSRVIWSSATDCNQTTKLRVGHIAQEKHRRCSDSNFSVLQPSTIGSDGADLDDLDDLNGDTSSLFTTSSGASTTAPGYKKSYNRTLYVSYITNVNDINDGNFSDVNKSMKKISVIICDDGLVCTKSNAITILNTYSANIGEVDYHSKVYP